MADTALDARPGPEIPAGGRTIRPVVIDGTGSRVFVVRTPEAGIRLRKSVPDEIWCGFGPEDLQPIGEYLRSCAPDREIIVADASEDDARDFLRRLSLETCRASRMIGTPPPPLTWLLRDSFLAGSVGLLVGPPGAGKSTFLLELGASIASGRPAFGGNLVPARSGAVLGLFCEESGPVLHSRVHHVVGQLASEQEADALYVVPCAGHDMRLMEVGRDGTPHGSAVFDDLQALAKRIDGLALIILDPLSRLYGANENDNTAATFFVTLLERLTRETGAAVLCSHHVAKGAGRDTKQKFSLPAAMSPDVQRGASALTGAVRWQANLFPMPAEAARATVGNPDARDGEYLAARVVKKNYGAPEQTFFLERMEGGLLVPAEAVTIGPTDEDARADAWVSAMIRAMADQGRQLTKRELGLLPERKAAGFSRAAIHDAADRLIFAGQLSAEDRRNSRGRTTSYLVPATPSGIPSASTPPIPSDTVTRKVTVCNTLNSFEVPYRQAGTPSKDSVGIKSSIISMQSIPSTPSPYGGRRTAGFGAGGFSPATPIPDVVEL